MDRKIISIIIGLGAIVGAIAIVGIATSDSMELLGSTKEVLELTSYATVGKHDPGTPVPQTTTANLGKIGGDVISESELALQSDMKYGKLKHLDTIMMNDENIDYLATKIESGGEVNRFYGTGDTFYDTKSLPNFLSEGGIIVTTNTMSNPEGVFASLANGPESQIQLVEIDGVVTRLVDSKGSGWSKVELYPGDLRIISLWANLPINDLIDLAKKLDVVDQGLDLKEYKDPDWGTNRDNVLDSEPVHSEPVHSEPPPVP